MSKLIVTYTALCIITSIALAMISPPLTKSQEETRRSVRIQMRRPMQRFARRQAQ